MKKLFIISLFTIYCLSAFGQHKVRTRESFNYDWLFEKGENIGAEKVDYDDSAWRKLDVPHDWAIEGPFDEKHDARTGGLPISGAAWYRKHFVVDKRLESKKITVEFDGVMDNSTVYINGHKIGERPFGYIGFEVDLTPFLNFSGDNVIAVSVAPKELSSRWYPGAGIYRNVWLETKHKTHIAHWGTYVTTPQVTDKTATVNIATTVDFDLSNMPNGKRNNRYYGNSTNELTSTSTNELTSTSTNELTSTSTNELTSKSSNELTSNSTNELTSNSTSELTSKSSNTKNANSYQLKYIILDADNKVVAQQVVSIESGVESVIHESSLVVKNPIRWDLETPYMYTLKSEILEEGKVVDDYFTPFGIRTISFTSDDGFLLNGRQERFRGVCLHHDLGPLGAAVNTRATERQLEIMKKAGVNAIRTSHNPPSPEQLALCDKMGILVQVESFDCWKEKKVENGYHLYWDEWHEQDLRDIIRRDRNHPSVVMWSIGNEIREQLRPHGGAMAQSLTDICHQEDPTRPTTAGFNIYPACVKNGLAAAIDVVGFNYKPTQYDSFLAQNPNSIVYGAETSSCVSSRGEYHLPLENYDRHDSFQITSYDIISPPWAYPPDFEIEAQNKMTSSLGEFVWTGFDYMGEPTPFNGRDNETHGRWSGDWPARSSYFGMVDLCGFPKDRFFFYQSVWTSEPMVHILPHWNWENSGVETIPVYCYTNCDEAELFLNGKSLGRKRMGVDKTTIPAEFNWWKSAKTTWDSPYRLNWNVDYEPGVLEVKAYRDGELVAEKSIVTSGKPAQIRLVPDRTELYVDGNDLSFVTVRIEDSNGNIVPNADNLVNFEIGGAGKIVAVGNGNAATTDSFQADYRKAFNGLCMVIIGTKRNESGEIKITAISEGLKPMTTTLKSK